MAGTVKSCKITVFANPHLFFVVYDDKQDKLHELESDLNWEFIETVVADPSVNELYVIKDKDGIYKRASFLKRQGHEFSCWLIDYGKVCTTEFLYTLTDEFKEKPLSFKAGLNKTVGLHCYINKYCKAEYVKTPDFPEGAVHWLKSRIIAAKAIEFLEEEVVNNVHYGQLFLTGRDGVKYNVIEKMCKEKILTVDDYLFNEALEKYKSANFRTMIDEDFSGPGIGRANSRRSKLNYIEDWLMMTEDQSEILSQCQNIEDCEIDFDENELISISRLDINCPKSSGDSAEYKSIKSYSSASVYEDFGDSDDDKTIVKIPPSAPMRVKTSGLEKSALATNNEALKINNTDDKDFVKIFDENYKPKSPKYDLLETFSDEDDSCLKNASVNSQSTSMNDSLNSSNNSLSLKGLKHRRSNESDANDSDTSQRSNRYRQLVARLSKRANSSVHSDTDLNSTDNCSDFAEETDGEKNDALKNEIGIDTGNKGEANIEADSAQNTKCSLMQNVKASNELNDKAKIAAFSKLKVEVASTSNKAKINAEINSLNKPELQVSNKTALGALDKAKSDFLNKDVTKKGENDASNMTKIDGSSYKTRIDYLNSLKPSNKDEAAALDKAKNDVLNKAKIAVKSENKTDLINYAAALKKAEADALVNAKSDPAYRTKIEALEKLKPTNKAEIRAVEMAKNEALYRAKKDAYDKTKAEIDALNNCKTNVLYEAKSEQDEETIDEKIDRLCNLEDPTVTEDDIPLYSVNNTKGLIKIGCPCVSCKQWNVSDFNTVRETFKKKEKRKGFRPAPLFINNRVKFPRVKTNVDVVNELPNQYLPKVMVHGTIIPHPQRFVKDIPFMERLHFILRTLDYSRSRPIQMYSWPAIMRNMNVSVTHTNRTGKTMVYVAPVCSFILEKVRYEQLPRECSPLVLIICPDSKMVEDVHDLILSFLKHINTSERFRIIAAFAPLDNHILRQFNGPIDVLLATPFSVIALLTNEKINLKRLCHLIIDGVDVVLEKYREPIQKLLKVTQQMIERRTCPNQVQFICTSEHWTKPMESLYKQLNAPPLICIGSHIEGALYGRADLQVHNIKSELKTSKLYEILKDNYRIYKTVVICKHEEIDEIREYLQVYGIRLTVSDDEMTGEDVVEAQKCWLCAPSGDNLLLITTDMALNSQLNITNASMLINYSLPNTWGFYVKRMGCLIDNYRSPFENSKAAFNCKILTFVDETSDREFPAIANYFHSVGLIMPERLQKFCEKSKDNQEALKIQAGTKLCTLIKEFSLCPNLKCQLRHQLSRQLDAEERKMMTGTLKFQIKAIKQINRYVVKLIGYETVDGVFVDLPDLSQAIDFAITKLKLQEVPEDIEADQMYILNEGGNFNRIIARKIVEYERHTKLPTKVYVEGIDNAFMKPVSANDLFEVPENIRALPPVLKEVIIGNIIPLNNERSWTLKSRKLVLKELDIADYKNLDTHCSGRILLELNNTIWISDLHVQKYLEFVNKTVTTFSLLKFLKERGLIQQQEENIAKLYDMCHKFQIDLPLYSRSLPEKKVVVHRAKPQWAHLADEPFNIVYFSSACTLERFYVRLQKFDPLLTQLQNDINKYIGINKFGSFVTDDVVTGGYYLAPDVENEKEYARVLILKIDGDKAHCFYVDFGDTSEVKLERIRPINDILMLKLPFQAIECSLYGVKQKDNARSTAATDVLYDEYCFEPNSTYYRFLYTHRMKTEKGTFKNTKHSILFYDYLNDTPQLINKVLIDKKLAVAKLGESLDNINFDLITEIRKSFNYEGDDEEMDDEEPEKKPEINKLIEFLDEQEDQFKNEDHLSEDDEFDFVIFNPNHFYEELGWRKKSRAEPVPSTSVSSCEPQPIKNAAPLSDVLKPQVLWYQTDKEVKMSIKLTVTDYTLKLVHARMLLFKANYDGRPYELKLQLYEPVNRTFKHSAVGLDVQITLTKIDVKEWPRLIFADQTLRYIKFDLEKCKLPDVDDDEDSKRLFLTIGEDREGETVDKSVMIDEVGSDYTDSEFSFSGDSDHGHF